MRRWRRRPAAPAVVVLASLALAPVAARMPSLPLVVSVAVAQDGLDAKERELEALRQRIEEHRAKAAGLARDEETQLARLREIEKETALLEELLAGLAEKEQAVLADIDSLEARIAKETKRLAARRAQLAQVLRAMYRRGDHATLAAVITSSGTSELAARLKALRHVARSERGVIDDVVRAQRSLRDQEVQLQERLAEVYRTRSETEDRRARLAGLAEERNLTLADMRQRRQSFEASAKELEQTAKALEELIAELERRREEAAIPATGGSFAERKGSLPWPVEGRVSKGFGPSIHPQFKTVIMNNGLQIAAPEGAPIRAVAAGTVEYVNWLPGYGRCIILNHGDGFYTLYAHASRIFSRKGDTVREGETIAEVGDTGSLDGDQLYFEIREGRNPVDPRAWLRRRRAP